MTVNPIGIYQADTPEVYAAKQQFASAYNQAARAAASASPNYAPAQQAAYAAQPAAYAPVEEADPGNSYPAAEPYIHVEVAAEPYVHVEVPAEPYVHIEPARKRGGRPVQQAAPAYQPQQPIAPTYINNPQPAYNQYNQYNRYGGCYNWKGEGVECRTQF